MHFDSFASPDWLYGVLYSKATVKWFKCTLLLTAALVSLNLNAFVPVEPLLLSDRNLIHKDIKSHMAWWSVGNRELPPQSIYEHLGKFEPLSGRELLINEAPTNIWLYFSLDTLTPEKLVLEILDPSIEVATLFKVSHDYGDQISFHLQKTVGLRYQDYNQKNNHLRNHFYLDLSGNFHQGFLLRLHLEKQRKINFKLWKEKDFLESYIEQNSRKMTVISSIILIMFISLVFSVISKTLTYSVHAIFGISILIFYSLHSGSIDYLLGYEHRSYITIIECLTLISLIISLFLIGMTVLKKEVSSNRTLIGKTLLILSGVLLFYNTIFPHNFFIASIMYLTLTLTIVMLSLYKYGVRNKSLPTTFTVSTIMVYGIVLLQYLEKSTELPSNYIFNEYIIFPQLLLFTSSVINLLKGMNSNIKNNIKEIQRLTISSESLSRDLKLKNHFISLISGQLKTPLVGFIGSMDLMKSTELTPRQKQYWSVACHDAEKLQALATELMNYTEVDSNTIKLKNEKIDFCDMLKKISAKYQDLCQLKNINWVYIENPQVPKWFLGDSSRIEQLINHLLDNAYKFTCYGEISLSVKVINNKKNQDIEIIGIEIIDSGLGISPDKLKIIFDPFLLSEQMDRRQFDGLGIGLMYCKKLCELMDGYLEIESDSGQGTRVVAWIHVNRLQSSENRIFDDFSLSALPANNSRCNLLLVEDNCINQIIFTGMLNQMGVKVITAENGEHAMDILKQSAIENQRGFDVVLMDCEMPVMDGFETARLIRASKKYFSRTPIIAVTAYIDDETFERCSKAGMDALLAKPLSMNDLEKQLIPWLDKEKLGYDQDTGLMNKAVE